MSPDRNTPHDPNPMHEPNPVHEPPPGAGAMNAFRWVLFAGLLVLAVASIAGYFLTRGPRGGRETTARAEVGYHCPMHPTYTSDRPGECPICGMNLEPIPHSPASPGTSAAIEAGDVPGLVSIHLAPERIQLIGVRTAIVQSEPLGNALDLVAFVAPDESRYHAVQLRVAGWIEKLHVSRTGERVNAGQPLLTLYSPELYQSESEYLVALGADLIGMGSGGIAAAARRRLELLGVPRAEIARLDRERKPKDRLTLPAPASGTVIERNVVEGQSVGPDTPLFTLADLSRVWVLADLYEIDVARLRVGSRAAFNTEGLPGKRFEGRVEFVSPTVSAETRTVQARIALDNRQGLLRPGMYGRVRTEATGAPGLVVPAEALVQAGEQDYVFLARAGGVFVPRRVQIGGRTGERVQLLGGVAEGDTVVSSASFLIDSESRLQAAISGMSGPGSSHEGHR